MTSCDRRALGVAFLGISVQGRSPHDREVHRLEYLLVLLAAIPLLVWGFLGLVIGANCGL